MQLRTGLAVFDRSDAIQVGYGPHAHMLTGITEKERTLLVQLRKTLPSSQARSRGRRLGIAPARLQALEHELAAANLLLDNEPETSAPATLRITIARVADPRQFHLLRPFLLTLLRHPALARCAVDITYLGEDLGSQPRQFIASDLDVVFSSCENPDLAIVVFARAPSTPLIMDLVMSHTPFLTVIMGEGYTEIGPYLQPDASPCFQCIDSYYGDGDDQWNHISTQLSEQPFPSISYSLMQVTAHTVVTVLTGIRNGNPPPVGLVHAIDESLISELYRFPPHPDCECGFTPDQWLDGSQLKPGRRTFQA
ncbi:MAG: hypothetical protein Q4P05_01835 [Actinomycetaceae bacterium]|nr:hypothetical protein [Actinomycetaceae bacterium]